MSMILPFAGRLEVDRVPVGSGCVVHASGLVVTCWHVVSMLAESTDRLLFVTLDGCHEFPVEITGTPDLRHDLALLRPRDGVRVPALAAARLLTCDSASAGDIFTIQGFGLVEDSGHDYQFLSATGRIIGPAQRDGIVLLEVESRQVLRGMSGAGVVLNADDGVVGVLSGRYVPPSGVGWLRDTGWVVPADQIAALSPGLLAVVPLRGTPHRVTERRSIWQLRGLQRAAVFTGRVNELDRLRELLPTGNAGVAVIVGIGGCGKTRLALEFAHVQRSTYDIVWLARADFLAADLRELAVALSLDVLSIGDLETALNGWLARNTRWLIIVDGADDPARIRDDLPTGAGHVLITSRDAQWGNIAVVLRLGMLEHPSAAAFLRRRGLDASDADLRALADAVGHLPLALEQAVSFLLATKRPINEYLDLLRDRPVELMADTEIADYAAPIATTWAVSFERLRKEAPISLEILRLGAFFSQDEIPLNLFTSAVDDLPPRFRNTLTDPLRLARTIAFLGRYSLAQIGTDGISIHPLVQTVVREVGLTRAERADYVERAVHIMRRTFPNDAEDVDHWPECSRLASHGISVATYAGRLGVEPTQVSWLLDRIGTYIQERVDPQTAIPYFESAVALAERVDGRSSELTQYLNNMASALMQLYEFPRAEEIFQRVLEIDVFRERRYREPIPAAHLFNYGYTLYSLGERDENAELIRQGRDLMDRAIHSASQSDSFFGVLLGNLAAEYRTRGDLDRASELAQLAEAAERQRVGIHHPAYAVVLQQIASIAVSRGDIEGATQMFKDAARINVDRLDVASPQTLQSFGAYFEMLLANGRLTESLELADWMRENLDFSDFTTMGQRDYDGGPGVLIRLGLGYLHGQRAEIALDCFYEAAGALESKFGPDSWRMALAENNIGFALLTLNRVTEARRAFERAVRLADHEQDVLAPVYEANLAIALTREGDNAGALTHANAALEADARNTTGDHGHILVKVATVEIVAGRPAAARTHLKKALDLLPTSQLTNARQQARRDEITRMLAGL